MLLKEKKILFFSVIFFGYEEKIKLKLEEFGAYVDFFNERSIDRKIDKAVFKIFPNIFRLRTYRYYKKIIKEKSNGNYDYIFIYGPDMITESIVKLIKNAFPSSKLFMYNADSVIGSRRVKKIIPYFDKSITYDRRDYNHYKDKFHNFVFRPLFFSDEYNIENKEKNNVNYSYGISFIGTVHSDRQSIINEIKKIIIDKEYLFFNYSYLQSKFMFLFYKITKKSFKNTKMRDFKYEKIKSSQIVDIFMKSKTILDMQYPKNIGLTIRSIEALGMKKKLITTNVDIVNYDFYNPQNIAVISRKNIKIDNEFLNRDFIDISKEVFNNYTLDSWIKDIFS